MWVMSFEGRRPTSWNSKAVGLLLEVQLHNCGQPGDEGWAGLSVGRDEIGKEISSSGGRPGADTA